MKTTLLIATILFPVILFAKTFELTSSFPDPSGSNSINFKLKWNEDMGKVKGTYTDDLHQDQIAITGVTSDRTRIFRIRFKGENQKIGAITIVTAPGQQGKDFPISVVAQDNKGIPVVAHKAQASLKSVTPTRQAQEARTCTDGFGNLAGFCGRYEGMVSEEMDKQKRCTLAEGATPLLELDENGMIILHVGPVSNIVTTPTHRIGRIPSDIRSNTVDVLSRECRPLAGTTFPGDDCKLVNLRGTFSDTNGRKHFIGDYNIRDEKNNTSCSYQLSLDLRG